MVDNCLITSTLLNAEPKMALKTSLKLKAEAKRLQTSLELPKVTITVEVNLTGVRPLYSKINQHAKYSKHLMAILITIIHKSYIL